MSLMTNEARQALAADLLDESILLEEIAISVRQNKKSIELPADTQKQLFEEYKQRTKETFKTLAEYYKQKKAEERSQKGENEE